MMKSYYFLLALLILEACTSNDEKIVPQKYKYASLEIVKGDKQNGKTGAFLSDTIVLKTVAKTSALRLDHFVVKSKMIKGNGFISYSQEGPPANIFYSDLNGEFKVFWSAGCNQIDQSAIFYLYNTDSCSVNNINWGICSPIDSVTINATTHTPSGWNKSCGVNWVDRYDTRMRSHNNKTYVSNQGILYKASMADALSWEKVESAPSGIHDFGFTSNGTIYVLTEMEGLYSSNDLQTWTPVNNGILDRRYPVSLLVEDSVVYASFYFDGLYRFRPSTNFWRKLLINGQYSDRYQFPTRHPNGNLYVVDKWDNYWVSKNSGDTWTYIAIENKYANYETEDLKISSSGLIYIGSGDASLAILSPDTYTGDLHTYYQWNASSQDINNIIFIGNNVYYLVNYTPNPGIYTSANGWQKLDIGFDKTIRSFLPDANGKFILGCSDGIYYWKD
ncbi:MAG TPA: hypothetical protein VIM65_09625 [Cyclobacteriaceae bacterium]